MLKGILVVLFLGELVAAGVVIYKNLKAMRQMRKAAEQLVIKVESIDMSKLSKEVNDEIRKQIYNLSFIGIKTR